MKLKAGAVIAIATALSIGMAGAAAASPAGHKPKPKPKPAPQVTGVRLQSALLPASAFGDGFDVFSHLNSGSRLWPTQVHIKPSSLRCQEFEEPFFVAGFGNTAGAADSVENPDPAWADYPSLVLFANQGVLQFKTTQAAASFYNQAFTKYQQCSAFTESDPTDSTDTFELTTQSLSKATINKDQAFQLTQLVDLSALPAASFYENTAVVLSGTDVYSVDTLNGTNDPISDSLLGTLIKRVHALYPRH
ncbi:MAG TPA: hypothetical protein VF070_43210 [Streptosporangiaceae bacterium]